MDASIDYYAILGVTPSAEDIVIRAAFRALAQRYHPDRANAGNHDYTARMAEINVAYKILTNQEDREQYDRLRGNGTKDGGVAPRENGEPPSGNAVTVVLWTFEAERELKKIPFFVRSKARRNTELFAIKSGIQTITVETLYDAKAYYGR